MRTTTLKNLISENNLYGISGITIPRIQRAYAQGRSDTHAVKTRERFLSAIQAGLMNNGLTLDFIYGNIQNGQLIPLDGQQRLTTLWLLHWYADKKEDINDKRLARFSYNTRYSARDFLTKLVNYKPTLKNRLSDEIRNEGWFPMDWINDPTVRGMLTMLDEIQERFSDTDDLWNKLDKINLESVGYNFYTGIIIKKPNNLSSFLVKKFTEHDFFDKSEVRKYYLSSTYEMIFYDLINNLEIIEYEHNKFINIRKLEETGFDKERLSTLQKEVCSLGENYDYFTIYKLKKEGAHFDIDELGYGDNLISSIVKVSKLLSYASFDNVIIFSKSRFTLGDFIKYIVKGFGDISLSELVNYLLKEYGILTSASKIRGFLRGTDIYIDSSGILYDSYKTYVENLKQEV